MPAVVQPLFRNPWNRTGKQTRPLEAFNNVVARIIHRAGGVRDLDYLFLKLRQESLAPDPPT